MHMNIRLVMNLNISILANLKKDINGSVLCAVTDEFKGKAELTVFYDAAEKFAYNNCDAVIVLGGDGTIIRAAKNAAPLGIPVCGINLGKIGFLAAAEVADIRKLAQRIISGIYKIEKRMMLEVSLCTAKGTQSLGFVLNDAAIGRGSYAKMIKLNFTANNDFLDSYMADGAVISTPTGSTAYSLSAGGPVVEPTMDLFMLTPICAYDLQTRSMVLPPDVSLGIEISGKQGATAMLSLDGHEDIPIIPGDKIIIKKSDYYAQFISLGDRSFYSVLRKKLGRKQVN